MVTEERLFTVINHAPLVLFAIDREGKFTLFEGKGLETLGLRPGEVVGRSVFEVYASQPAMVAACRRALAGEALSDTIHMNDMAFDAYYRPLVDAQDRVAGVVGIATDVTDRQRAIEEIQKRNQELEARVAERTAQLESSNRALESFAYTVSHDLRAPLRTVDGFGQMLVQDHAERLDPKGRDLVQRMRNATVRMGHLMDALLELSRVSRLEIRREPINLTDMALSVAAELKLQEPEREVDLHVQMGLADDGDSRLVRDLLYNLLANAWKFTRPMKRPRIEFGAERQGGVWVYYLRDNGVGFDRAYATKLFRPFERLHGQAEFEGSGIGLATAQRIVARHGGKIWADAAKGRGATFYFTLDAEGAPETRYHEAETSPIS